MSLTLAHDSSIKKEIEGIKKDLKNSKYSDKVISFFQVGSTTETLGNRPTNEDNESSDVDLIFIADSDYLLENRSELEEYISKFRSDKIEVWLKSKDQYEDPDNYFMPGHPANALKILDGWDGLAGKIGFAIELTSGKTLYGSKIIENLREKYIQDNKEIYIPPEEGSELITVATRDLLKGLSGRTIDSGIEAILLKEENLDKEEAREAFNSYLNKQNVSKDEQNLTRNEKLAKDYILTKDNDIAKATLRTFLGVYVHAANKFVSNNPTSIYSEIRDKKDSMLSGQERKKWRDLIDYMYKVKVNKKEIDGEIYDNLIEWDWTGKNKENNKSLVDLVSAFFKECSFQTSEGAFMRGYTSTYDSQKRKSYHLSRRTPGIIEIINNFDDNEYDTLENAIDLYLGEIIRVFTNELTDVFEEDKLKSIFKNKENILQVMERLVKSYTLPKDIVRSHKDRMLQVGQMQLLLAKNGKKEYYFDAEKTLKTALQDFEPNVFDMLAPPRTSWTFDKEATAHLTLGECLLDLDKEEEAKKHLEKSIGINPRSSYSWDLLSELTSDNSKKEFYNLISESLKDPDKLLGLRLIVKDIKDVERELYAPWRNLIKKQLNNYEVRISKKFMDLLYLEKDFFNILKFKEDNVLSVLDYLKVIKEEKDKLRNLFGSLEFQKSNLEKLGGENYIKLEKVVSQHVRNSLFEHDERMRKNSLTVNMINNLEELKRIEPKFRENPEKNLNKYFNKSSKVSFSKTLKILEDLKEKNKISEEDYNNFYEELTPHLPENLEKEKEKLEELLQLK